MTHNSNNDASRQPHPNGNSGKEKFSIVKDSDWEWALNQHHTVSMLWMECWKSDPFGDRFSCLVTKSNISSSNFRQAKKILQDSRLFEFKPVQERSSSGQLKTVSWLIRNTKGSRAIKQEISDKVVSYSDKVVSYSDSLQPETLATASFQNPSLLDPVRIQEKEINTRLVDHVLDPIPTQDQNKKLDQAILDPCASVQERESVYGDDATLNATHPESLVRAKAKNTSNGFDLSVGMQPTLDATVAHKMIEVDVEHNHAISDSQKAQEATYNHTNDGLIKTEKRTRLDAKFAQYYSERAMQILKNPIDPVLLQEPFSPLVNEKQAKTFGRHLRRLAERSIGRRLNKSEIREALTQDWDLIKNQEKSDRLLELLRTYIRYNFQEIANNIYVSTLYKYVV